MMQTKHIEAALPIAAKLLAGRLDIELVYGGDTAMTNGRKVIIPHLPIESDRARILAFGYLVHENGHIRDTDFTVGAKQQPLSFMENILEDIRIERKAWERYPGSRKTLSDLVNLLVTEGKMGYVPTPDNPINVLMAYMLHRLRATVLQQSALEPSAVQSEAVLRSILPEQVCDTLTTMMFSVRNATSTLDVVVLAKEIYDYLMSQFQQPPQQQQPQPQPPQQQDQSQEDAKDSDGAAGQGKDDAESDDSESDGAKPEGSGGSGDEEAEAGSDSGQDQSGGEGEGSNDADPSSQSGSDTGAGQGDTNEGEGSSSSTPGQQSGDDNAGAAIGELTDQQREALRSILEATQTDVATDLGDVIAEELSQPGATCNPDGSANDLNFPEVHVAPGNPAELEPMMKATRSATIALRRRMEDLLEAQRRCSWRSANSGKRFNASKAWQLKGGNTRIFDKRTEGREVNTAVLLLLDRSGSMSAQLPLASQAILSLAFSLYQVDKVQVAAAAFPAPEAGRHPSQPYYQYGKDVLLLTGFGERVSATAPRYAGLEVYGGTPLPEALLWAHYELLMQNVDRRILMVATDGDPQDLVSSAKILDIGTAMGIETVGLGIGIDIRHLIPDSRQINSIEEMPKAVFAMMEKKMVLPMAA